MLRRLASFAAALVAATPLGAQATIQYAARLKVTGAAVTGTQATPRIALDRRVRTPGGATFTAPSVRAAVPSPYRATATFTWGGGRAATTSAFNVFCVDMFNAVTFSSTQGYDVIATSLLSTTLASTRYTDAQALTRYRKAGFLSALWTPAMARTDVDDLQMAIWHVMYDGFSFPGSTAKVNLVPTTAASTPRTAAFVAQAEQVAAANFAGVDFRNAYVLTDRSVRTASNRYVGGRQEFVTGVTYTPPTITVPPTSTVPEPASVALLGTGLVGVLVAARRRRDA